MRTGSGAGVIQHLHEPETIDGEVVLKTPFPRLVRGELPVGRGILAHRGKTVRIQFPLVAADG